MMHGLLGQFALVLAITSGLTVSWWQLDAQAASVAERARATNGGTDVIDWFEVTGTHATDVDDDGGRDNDDDDDDESDRRRRGRSFPPYPDGRRDRWPDPSPRWPDPRRDGRVYDLAFDTGYRDGVEKGDEDARRGRSFDVTRHGWYRSGDRGYDGREGSRAAYRRDYRDGFTSGYDRGYGANRGRRGRAVPRWPFPW